MGPGGAEGIQRAAGLDLLRDREKEHPHVHKVAERR